MSQANQSQSLTVGATLTGGIQDVSAILPLIGTEQCESHVGSALAGGYLYAASSVLSIFGSLGITKAGFSVLFACVSFPKPWISSHDGKFEQSMVFGAKYLQNSAFGLKGDVAPMIGMEGTRFKAETKLIQMMEEKHIDNPEKVSIRWNSKAWNINLVLFTMVAAVMSGIPYFALFLGKATWQPTDHVPWTFPILRTVGSCFASILCQFIIQARVISLMKYRIMFMDIHRQLSNIYSQDNKEGLNNWIKEHKLQWDPNLPAEQCILNLEHFLAPTVPPTQTDLDPQEAKPHIAIEMVNIATPSTSPPPPSHPPGHVKFDLDDLQDLRQRHFPSPSRDRAITLISWTILLLSLPAAVVGYVGCFTLVRSSQGNGPLVWLGLEAGLSIIRMIIWAWNPKFDENTGITVELELIDNPLLVTTVEHNAFIHDSDNERVKPLVLVREREFLEWITPFTGPLDQFANPVNVALHFTLTADYSTIEEDMGRKCTSLLLTVFDFNTRVGVTMLKLKETFYLFDAEVNYATIYNEISANLQLPMSDNHPWQIQDSGLFSSLEDHYNYVGNALIGRANEQPLENIVIPERRRKRFWELPQQAIERENISTLDRRWDLFPKATLTQRRNSTSWVGLPNQTNHDQPYLDRGYEHYLKAELVAVWGRWIVENMEEMARDGRNDCYEALADETSEKAKWELTELDCLVVLEWANRELALLTLSLELKANLRLKMEKCISTVCKDRNDGRLERRLRSEFDVGRRKRLDKERGEAKKRMEQAMKDWGERAERKGRSWEDETLFAPMWQPAVDFVDERWLEGISQGPEELRKEDCGFWDLDRRHHDLRRKHGMRFFSVKQVDERFTHWRSQREDERREMDTALGRICRVDGQREQMDVAYKYPRIDGWAVYKFVYLPDSSSTGRTCSAMVYDAWLCSAKEVCGVIEKSTTRSVINVNPTIVASIPPNDHLLFLNCDGDGEEPAFVQDNSDRWWRQQTTNSALFYFTPDGVHDDSCFVYSGPIAQIFVFLTAPSRVRLRLLHYSYEDVSVAIQHKDETFHTLPAVQVPKTLKLQSVELQELGAGRHELQVVATEGFGRYHLRDILVEFFKDYPTPGSPSANDTNGIWPTIGAEYTAEEISSRSSDQSSLHLPPTDAQDAEPYILHDPREFETGV